MSQTAELAARVDKLAARVDELAARPDSGGPSGRESQVLAEIARAAECPPADVRRVALRRMIARWESVRERRDGPPANSRPGFIRKLRRDLLQFAADDVRARR